MHPKQVIRLAVIERCIANGMSSVETEASIDTALLLYHLGHSVAAAVESGKRTADRVAGKRRGGTQLEAI